MDLAEALVLAFELAIFATAFATGLATTSGDLAYLRDHPGLLLRSLFVLVLIAPIAALLVWRVLPIGAPAAIALLAGALAAGLPLVFRGEPKRGGNVAYARSLMFVASMVSVITIPLWLAILRRFAGVEVAVTSTAMARTLTMWLLLPLLAGAAVQRLAPAWSERVIVPVAIIANALTPALGIVLLIVGARSIAQLGWTALVATMLAPLLALALGHAFGGPDARDRPVLAIASAGRFPALAALIAATSFPAVPAALAMIACLAFANLVVAFPYWMWRKRTQTRGEAPSTGAQPSAATTATVTDMTAQVGPT